LKLTYEKPGDQVVSERREELLKQLDTLMAEKVAAEEKVKEAELERDRAAQELEAKKKAVDASAAAARTLRAKDVWELVTIEPSDREELQHALDKLGVGKVLASVADVRNAVDELRSVRTRTSLLANWIVQQPASLVWLLCGLLAAPFVAMGMALLVRWISPETYGVIAQSVTHVTAFVTVITGWLAQRLSSVKKVLATVDAARSKIDEKIESAAARIQSGIESADNAVAKASADVTSAQEDVVKREQAVMTAKNELLKLTNGYRLNRFIDERAASDDYRKLLGVLATVRSDFAMLSELMHPKSGGTGDLGDHLRIDRIILYIDDLDRCEPERVIEVLQAVHLLLAFKLFVVVVGVDARWVSESLRQKHRALRGKSERQFEQEDDITGYAVEPHDYLEKIFQVPFWLDPLKPRTAGTYIANLLSGDLEEKAGAQQKVVVRTTPSTGNTQSANEPQRAPEVLHTMCDGDGDELDPQQLTIDPKERDYMQREELACLVSRSPRTAKRFVNTYRFFRASIPRDSLAAYLAEAAPAEYRCALLMLAIVVGAPNISLELFKQMRAQGDAEQSLQTFVPTVTVDDDDAAEWKIVHDALREFGKRESASLSHLLPHIERVSRYSFRPPHNLAQRKKVAAKPEYLIRISNDEARPRV
ncbi:MAG TPA: P-loop NTPase fold protein, partial [Thermoanaerobaculia bacterium]